MDFLGYFGRTDHALGVQLCARCADGPRRLAAHTLGHHKGRRGRGVPVRLRAPPDMSDEEYQLWCVQWLADFVTGLANGMTRTGMPADELLRTWFK